MNPKVSIIVPIYNVERYLDKCVESLRSQTLKDIEIILVDDGSLDASGKMADNYALNDARIKVVHQENGGLGPARNSGIEVATGQYLGFVDSDDWVDPSMYARLFSKTEEACCDVVYSGMKVVSNGELLDEYSHPYANQVINNRNEILDFKSCFYGTLPSKEKICSVPVSVCNGLYKRSLVEKFNIRFKNIRSEDIFFNIEYCEKSKSIAFIDGAFYNYRKDRQQSITETLRIDTINNFLDFLTLLNKYATNEDETRRSSCILRVKRCVIDSCRIMIQMINRGAEAKRKQIIVADLVSNPLVKQAVESYPWTYLPFGQAIFYFALKYEMTRTLLFLASARSLLPLNGNRGKNDKSKRDN